MSFEERRFKLVVLGTTGVGKTCLTLRFAKGVFDEEQLPTIGAAYMTKQMTLTSENESESEEKSFMFEIWDTAGQERYEAITPLYYRSSEAALIVFDLTSNHSFEKARQWLDRLRKERPDPKMPICLVGNKCDVYEDFKKRQEALEEEGNNFELDVELADEEAVEAFVKEKNLKYFKASAKTGVNVDEIFKYLALNLPSNETNATKQGAGVNLSAADTEENNGCC